MTQVEQLREAFDNGETLTVAQALERMGIYALSQRCGELARSGYPLHVETVTLANGKRIARYSKQVRKQADERLCQQEGGEAVSGASAAGEGGRDLRIAEAGEA